MIKKILILLLLCTAVYAEDEQIEVRVVKHESMIVHKDTVVNTELIRKTCEEEINNSKKYCFVPPSN